MISDLDMYLFGQGTHYEIYKKLGAHPCEVGGVWGFSFAVWAPHAVSVSVVGDFNGWDEQSHPMRKTGSQGQCKTYTIALRMAQFEFLKQYTGTTPILLLDDIFDKLDERRVVSIINVVSNNQDFGQIFITDTNRTHLDEIISMMSGDYAMFVVENGIVTPIASRQEETHQ